MELATDNKYFSVLFEQLIQTPTLQAFHREDIWFRIFTFITHPINHLEPHMLFSN